MPFVTLLAAADTIIEQPTWGQVETAIRTLGRDGCDLVVLSPDPVGGDHHMALGGDESRVLVYLTEDNLAFWNASDSHKAGERSPVALTIGGQEGDYEERQFIQMEQAVRAAMSFFLDGSRWSGLLWTLT